MPDGTSPAASEQLFVRVYDALRAAAARQLRGERQVTQEPSAIVHEVYVRMIRRQRTPWRNEAHLKALAVAEMRRVLVDAARRRRAHKRGGGRSRVPLRESTLSADPPDERWLDLDRTLRRLGDSHPRQARVAALSIVGGFADREVAAALGVSDRTIRSDRRFATAWLRGELAS